MGDNWDDAGSNNNGRDGVGDGSSGGGGRMNPTAASFSFNPGTTAFLPSVAGGGDKEVAPPSANDLAAELAAMAAIARGEASKPEASKPEASKPEASKPEASKPEASKSKEARPEPVPAYTPEERAAHKEKVTATLAQIDAEDARQHMNVVFIGHVDAGKSTTAGQILFLTGGVDDRTIEKYEREAKEKNRESWYMAYIMDTNEEERAKGKTVEVGRAHFETEKKRYTILDAPGHKSFVPNMISGASQADIGVLVISARKGEFETGFERGGQTREHAQLAKTLGVSKLVVAVNKMDDPSIVEPGDKWSKPRFDEIVTKLTPFLKGCGYKPSDLVYVPISGLMGKNMKTKVGADVCPWYDLNGGAPLFEILDRIEPSSRDPYAPFRMPIMDKYKDMGTIVMGKCESGVVRRGDKLTMMPNKVPVKVATVWRDEVEVEAARPGENLRLRLSGIDEEDVSSGFVLSDDKDLVPVVHSFEAQIAVLDLLEHKPILTGGYTAILHLHSIVEECEVTKMVWALDPKTREKKKTKFVKSNSVCAVRIKVAGGSVCMESFADNPQLGRFTLRDEGRTIAIGKVLRLPSRG